MLSYLNTPLHLSSSENLEESSSFCFPIAQRSEHLFIQTLCCLRESEAIFYLRTEAVSFTWIYRNGCSHSPRDSILHTISQQVLPGSRLHYCILCPRWDLCYQALRNYSLHLLQNVKTLQRNYECRKQSSNITSVNFLCHALTKKCTLKAGDIASDKITEPQLAGRWESTMVKLHHLIDLSFICLVKHWWPCSETWSSTWGTVDLLNLYIQCHIKLLLLK